MAECVAGKWVGSGNLSDLKGDGRLLELLM